MFKAVLYTKLLNLGLSQKVNFIQEYEELGIINNYYFH